MWYQNPTVTNPLNLRSSPDTTSNVVGTLGPGDAAELLEDIPFWYRIILFDGTEGFIGKAKTHTVAYLPVAPSRVRISAWNIKKLGHGKKKDFGLVAGVI